MSEMQINVLDAQRALHSTIHGSTFDCLVAALSADPETIDELEAALARFLLGEKAGFFKHWRSGTNEEPWDAGVGIIDLAARLVAFESTYSSPGPTGHVRYRGDEDDKDIWLTYHLADNWLLTGQVEGWESLARKRRQERLAKPPLDARAVLYGKVCEFIADECLAGAARKLSPSIPVDEEEAEHVACEAIKDIHARWLLTPRDDLRGQAPRDLLLARQPHISWEMQDRSEQWSMLGQCPPGLPPSAAAYRYGGFGTHEIVLYYDLLRFLLHKCWEQVTRSPEIDRKAEIRRLEVLRDQWLETPDPMDLHGWKPAYVIERERARLPMAVSGHEAMVDHDCPLCQMMAEDSSPFFWNLDGCNMDDDFAFSFHPTRAEWEKEQREYEEFSRQCNEKWRREQAAGGIENADVWKTSYSAPESESADSPFAFVLFGIGAHLAELTQNLRDAGSGEFIEALNRHFGNLREAAADPTAADPTAALVEPVVHRFCENLNAAADTYPELAAKCGDLERRLRKLSSRLSDEPTYEEDVPF
jgi:hypothetical protein